MHTDMRCAVLLAVIFCLDIVSAVTHAHTVPISKISGTSSSEISLTSASNVAASKRLLRSHDASVRVESVRNEERTLKKLKNVFQKLTSSYKLQQYAKKEPKWLQAGRSPTYVFHKMEFEMGTKIEENLAFVPWLQYVNKLRERETDSTKRRSIVDEIFSLLELTPTPLDDVLNSITRVQGLEDLGRSLQHHKTDVIESSRKKLKPARWPQILA
ncbi:unnamed protein product [Phytophthora fragariaefolia]|uniref:RxLR effector protein n=1 Tax=Phytophthora fragariaefolia TaxID=1490495 RepID=A0A9W6XTE0_9STRA|nr:unnamed protein product [Phytophthora fragariaefolia]